MAKDILLFGSIWQYTAMYFFDQIKEATKENPNEEMSLRINSDGGSPDYSMSMIEKVREMQSQFSIKVGAQAHSSALFFLCYVDTEKVECIDTTQAILHRAAFPTWFEKSEGFAGSMYEQMRDRSNKDLEKAFRAKVNVEELENLSQFKDKNLKLKDIFSTDNGARVEVLLTASDLKKIGLVSKVNRITPQKQAELQSQYEAFKECKSLQDFKLAAQAVLKEEKPEISKQVDMTIEKLKAEFPAIYAAIVLEGTKKEKDRVEAWMAYQDIDSEAVKKGIESGEEVTMKVVATMQVKGLAKVNLKDLKEESAQPVTTPTAPKATAEKTEKEKEIAAFTAEVDGFLGLNKK